MVISPTWYTVKFICFKTVFLVLCQATFFVYFTSIIRKYFSSNFSENWSQKTDEMGRSTVLGPHLSSYMHHLTVYQWFHSNSSRISWINCSLTKHFNNCFYLDNPGHISRLLFVLEQQSLTDILSMSSNTANSPIY